MSTATAETKPAEVLDPGQVAEMVRVSRATVLKWARDGSMPKPVWVGKTVRWPRAVIEDWIAGRGRA